MSDAATEAPPVFRLADMTVIGKWPPKMMKALAVIATELHPAYDQIPETSSGWSKQTCVFASLAVRDFLVAIGYPDATGRPVATVMLAHDRDGKLIHSLGIGIPGDPDLPGKFNGHLVCAVPSLRLLIDTTLYQAIRPAWGGALNGMMAVDYDDQPVPNKFIYGRRPITAWSVALPDRTFDIVWTDRPELRWKRDSDYQRSARRRAVTQAMIERFGQWQP